MSRTSKLVLIIALAGAIAGCKKEEAEPKATTPADAAAAAPTVADAAAAAPTAADAAAAAALTDAQIVAIITAANTAEVEGGKLAQKKAKNADVKKFAAMMVKHHGTMNEEGAALAKKVNLTPEESDKSKQLTSDAAAAAETLGKLEGADFDKAYLDNQATMHQALLDSLDKELIPAAQNPELKAMLEKARGGVQEHLDQVKALQGKVK